MVQGYYTLEESAQLLGISADELKQLWRKGDIRSFQDRGTWRFRIQDIQEMARRTGRGSEPDLPLGEVLTPKPTDSPAPRGPVQQKKREEEVFGFSLDAEAEDAALNLAADADIQVDAKKGSKGSKGSTSSKRGSAKSKVQPGSDSDVRLVADGSDVTFSIPVDSDVKVVEQPGAPKSGPRSGTAVGGPKSPRPAKTQLPDRDLPGSPDSGVRLVPIDSDSDVRIVGPGSDEFDAALGANPPRGTTDSDIRLEGRFPATASGETEGLLTEEINLDEELKKDEAKRQEHMKQAKLRPKEPEFPTTSPFELSEDDLDLEAEEDEAQAAPQVKKEDSSSDFDLTPAKEEGSSDFDLSPAGESSSPLELGSSDDFRLEVPDEDDQATLSEDGTFNLKGQSGINLGKPADSGISLEQTGESSDEIEFSLTLDAESTPKPGSQKPSTPKPAKAAPVAESSDSSEFELSLDLETQAQSDSDSEFELTLDDAGSLEPLEAAEEPAAGKGEDKDIFETDFDVPGLEEDSGSSAVAVEDADTELESSDFELAINEEDGVAEGEESGSMVLALDELDEEAEVDDAAETVTAKSRQKKQPPKKPSKKTKGKAAAAADDAGFADLDAAEPLVEEDAEVEAEADAEVDAGGTRVVRETVVLQQAPWGVLPTLVLFPCVIVMVLLGIMGFELVQQQQGYKPGFLTKAIAGMIDKKK